MIYFKSINNQTIRKNKTKDIFNTFVRY